MSTSAITGSALTLLDWAKRLDPNGKVPTIVELLNQTNESSMICSGKRAISRPAIG